MKTSNEWLKDIHEKADKRFAEQKRRRKIIVSISSSAACLALILCAAIAVPNLIGDNGLTAVVPPESSGTNQTLDNTHNNNGTIGSEHTDNPIVTPPSSEVNPGNPTVDDNEYPNLALLSLSQWQQDADVVWGDGTASKGNVSTGINVDLGKTFISNELNNAFKTGDDNTVYAVMVDFTPMLKTNILIDGKTISEWKGEIEALVAQDKNIEAKEIAQKIKQAKEDSYFEQLKEFETKFASMGLGVYHENWGCTIDNCIFYTFATREQIENFECAPNEAFVFTSAIRFK